MLYHEVPNPYLTIRNFLIAVGGGARVRRTRGARVGAGGVRAAAVAPPSPRSERFPPGHRRSTGGAAGHDGALPGARVYTQRRALCRVQTGHTALLR
jgi:hypothetical protein